MEGPGAPLDADALEETVSAADKGKMIGVGDATVRQQPILRRGVVQAVSD